MGKKEGGYLLHRVPVEKETHQSCQFAKFVRKTEDTNAQCTPLCALGQHINCCGNYVKCRDVLFRNL